MSSARIAFAAVALLLVVGTSSADDYWVYLGTYTGKGDKDSKGIYRAKLNSTSGELSDLQLAAEAASPSFLTISPNNKFLYAVGETPATDGKGGLVYAFKLDAKTGELTKLNEERSGGEGPCHISVNRTGKFAIVANYGGGSTALFKLKDDGSFDSRTDYVEHKDGGKKKALGHCAMFAGDGATTDAEFAYGVDAGLDRVFMFKLDGEKGKLVPNEPASVKLPDGSGPRHIAFNPNTGKAYVCGESASTVMTLRHDRTTGVLEFKMSETAVVSTLPADTPADVRKKNSTAEVVVHPSKGYVFVSNRGHDSIATFKVTVEETKAGPHLTGAGDNTIKTPRNFNVDPTGKWILVANQDGGTVRVIEWSNEAGNGKMTGHKVEVKNPVCVKFVPVAK